MPKNKLTLLVYNEVFVTVRKICDLPKVYYHARSQQALVRLHVAAHKKGTKIALTFQMLCNRSYLTGLGKGIIEII